MRSVRYLTWAHNQIYNTGQRLYDVNRGAKRYYWKHMLRDSLIVCVRNAVQLKGLCPRVSGRELQRWHRHEIVPRAHQYSGAVSRWPWIATTREFGGGDEESHAPRLAAVLLSGMVVAASISRIHGLMIQVRLFTSV